jgi:hypothetical protein
MSSLTLFNAPNTSPDAPDQPVTQPAVQTGNTMVESIATPPKDPVAPLTERVATLEDEVLELRQHVTQLAEVVVGEIKERRAIQAQTEMLLPVPIPAAVASMVPGGETTVKAVNALRRPWLLVDLLKDLALMVRMYFDPRYRVRRATQMMVPLILACFLAAYFMFAWFDIPVLSPILERLIDILLAVLLYKVIHSELTRYRGVLALYTASRLAGQTDIPASLLHNDPDEAAVSRQGEG